MVAGTHPHDTYCILVPTRPLAFTYVLTTDDHRRDTPTQNARPRPHAPSGTYVPTTIAYLLGTDTEYECVPRTSTMVVGSGRGAPACGCGGGGRGVGWQGDVSRGRRACCENGVSPKKTAAARAWHSCWVIQELNHSVVWHAVSFAT